MLGIVQEFFHLRKALEDYYRFWLSVALAGGCVVAFFWSLDELRSLNAGMFALYLLIQLVFGLRLWQLVRMLRHLEIQLGGDPDYILPAYGAKSFRLPLASIIVVVGLQAVYGLVLLLR